MPRGRAGAATGPLLAGLLAWLCLAAPQAGASGGQAVAEAVAARDRALIQSRLQGMPPPVPGTPDLYALAFAGDGDEDVFRNEALYFEELASVRYGAAGRALALVNHPDSLHQPRPLATPDNLRLALEGIGGRMDPREDLLLLFVASHGSPGHALTVRLAGHTDTVLRPGQLRALLDASGIRNRVLIVSACYSGGFIADLDTPDTLVITAARHDRPSFGCGDSGSATWFGRALLVEGLNREGGLVEAFAYAARRVGRRERQEGFDPSHPQISIGDSIGPRLRAFEAGLERGPPLPYPHPPGE